MEKELLREDQQEKALKMADELARSADAQEVAKAAEGNGPWTRNKYIKAIWDKVQILIAIVRSPLFARTITLAAAGALAYMLSPIDVIPDVIIGLGFLDDAFILTTVFAKVVTNIKSDPAKALKFVDTLPDHLKKPAMTLFGLAGGAVAGAKLGAMGGDWLKENSASELYEKINPEGGDLMSAIGRRISEYVNNLLSSQLRKAIKESFEKRISRGLLILVLFLLSVLLTLEPIFSSASAYIASSLLLIAYGLSLYALFNNVRKLLPYLKSIWKEKDILLGVEEELVKQYEILKKGKDMIMLANEKLKLKLKLGPEELKKIAQYLLSCFWKECLFFLTGTLVMILAFFLLRYGLVNLSLSLTPLELLFFPFFA